MFQFILLLILKEMTDLEVRNKDNFSFFNETEIRFCGLRGGKRKYANLIVKV